MIVLKSILFYITSFFLAVTPTSRYVEGVVGQPRSFLPSHLETLNDKTISKLIYRGLFKYDNYGTLIPDLADSWAISNDGLVYTIKLKDKQLWSDGTRITADDLLYTSYKITDLQGVATDKIDNLTVRYTLPNKFSPFLSLMTVGIMQSNSEDLYNHLTPVSSGSFRVLRITRKGPAIREVMLINKDLNKNMKRLVFRYYSNEDEVLTAAKLGEIDGFVGTKVSKPENFKKYEFPLQGIYYALFFNLKDKDFLDLEFREKLAKTLPVEDLITGYGINVEGAISRSPFTTDTLASLYDETFEDDLAGQSLELTVPDIAAHTEIAERIKDIWEKKLNLEVTIKAVSPSKIEKDVISTRKFKVLLYGQEIGRDPDRYVNWHSTQKDDPGLNLSGFEHVRADRALEEGRKEIDNDKRAVHYDEFQKLINEQVPSIFLYHPYMKYYVSSKVAGIGEKYTFSPEDRFLDFAGWKRVETN